MNQNRKTQLIIIIIITCISINAQHGFSFKGLKNSKETDKKSITIELRIDPALIKDSGLSKFAPVNYTENDQWISKWQKPINGVVKWIINTDTSIYLDIRDLLIKPKLGIWMVEPGDQIIISSKGNEFHFSGKGSKKLSLQFQLDSLSENFPQPANHRDYSTSSIADYLEWSNFLENKMELTIQLIDTYKNKIPEYSLDQIRDRYAQKMINNLNAKFGSLLSYITSNRIDLNILCKLFDSAHYRIIQRWSPYLSNKAVLDLSQFKFKIYRQHSFDGNKIPPKSIININYYKEAIKTYIGSQREQFITRYLPEQLMIEVGFTSEVESLLTQYYAEPMFPEHKKRIRELELKIRERKIAFKAPVFSLKDNHGNRISSETFKGKFAILSFWNTGSARCELMAKALKIIQDKFHNDSNIVFVNISLDKEKSKWLTSVANGIYTTRKGIHLYTEGKGMEHQMIRNYAIPSSPMLLVMHPDSRILRINSQLGLAWTGQDNINLIIETIQKNLAFAKDGPYVFHEDSTSIAWYINKNILSKHNLYGIYDSLLIVQTDSDISFSVSLKRTHRKELSVYEKPNRLLVLSDIEGNFDALRKLLQANKVIDENFNWTFGDGHLVFLGDMFDRGLQVTECLWLLYSLEEKSKASNGYVHFILGNHEIMNLQGDHRYAQSKYKNIASLMGKELRELYSANSELGKWLRTKNIMEQIGDLLFVHGGISHQVWRMPLGIREINDLSRPYYSKAIDSTNQYLATLFGNRRTGNEKSYTSPFWFRGYYGDIDNPYEIPSIKQVDSTLQKFNVNRIITGHSIVADTISVWYEGKVINTDTKHAEGKSEALLIENERYYRVNTKGIRKKLISASFSEK